MPVKDPGLPNLAKSLFHFLTLKGLRSAKESFLALAAPQRHRQAAGDDARARAAWTRQEHSAQGQAATASDSSAALCLRPCCPLALTALCCALLSQALAGRHYGDRSLKGEILYNNMTHAQASKQGVHIERLTAYVDQGEVHLAHLTVRETLQFAVDNAVADPALLNDPAFVQQNAQKVDFMLELLNLKEAEHTILGNALVRGVSGGQRRRVTLGEMMITNARALFLDEITTGLDSTASFDILTALRQWTAADERQHHDRAAAAHAGVLRALRPASSCCGTGQVVYDGAAGRGGRLLPAARHPHPRRPGPGRLPL